jgi:integrase
VVLTAARTSEALGMTWDEVDLDSATWTVPAARMKGGKEHRVPLSDSALAILKAQHRARGKNPHCFPSPLPRQPLSSMSLLMLLRRLKADVTTHGFRSSFRDWTGDETDFAREVAEAALAHAVGDQSEQAYRRGTALAKRRDLMDAWAAYLAPQPAKVVPIKRRAR